MHWTHIAGVVAIIGLLAAPPAGSEQAYPSALATPEKSAKPDAYDDDLIQEIPMTFRLISPVFMNGAALPIHSTCDGRKLSPPLSWTAAPQGAKSLALIADDPDAPGKTWVHWVLYNMPPTTLQLAEGIPHGPSLPDGSRQGRNDSGDLGYDPACPPSGTHRYVFKLYALDAPVTLEPGASKADLEQAMNGHILAQTQLLGTYRRGQ